MSPTTIPSVDPHFQGALSRPGTTSTQKGASSGAALADVATGFLGRPAGSRVSTKELLVEVEEYFALGATVSPGDTMLDVGANTGAFALRVANTCGSDVRLLCFEPSPWTFAALQSSFDHNPSLKRTRHDLHQIGVTSSENSGKRLPFYHFHYFPTNSTLDIAAKRREFEMFFESRGRALRGVLGPLLGEPLARAVSWLPKGRMGRFFSDKVMGLEEVSVNLVTLDEVIQKEAVDRVDLLKIDVEGHEVEVLRGLGPSSWPKVKQVVLETHNRDGRQGEIEALLQQHGLTRIRSVRQTAINNGLESQVLLATRPT